MINLNLSLIRKLASVAAFAFAGIASAFAQSVTVDITSYIQGALGSYNGGYYLANAIGTATVTHVTGGVPQGTNTSGEVGTNIGIPRIGTYAGLSVTWNLTLSADGYIVINYTSHIGWLKKSGQIITNKSAAGLPGYQSPSSGPSSSSHTTSYDDYGADFGYTTTTGDGLAYFNVYWYYDSSTSEPQGNVTIGEAVVVNWWE